MRFLMRRRRSIIYRKTYSPESANFIAAGGVMLGRGLSLFQGLSFCNAARASRAQRAARHAGLSWAVARLLARD